MSEAVQSDLQEVTNEMVVDALLKSGPTVIDQISTYCRVGHMYIEEASAAGHDSVSFETLADMLSTIETLIALDKENSNAR